MTSDGSAESATQPSRKSSLLKRLAVAGGLFTGLALGGYGIAAAAGSSSTTTPSSGPSAPGKVAPPGHFGFGRLGGFAGIGGIGGLVHGEFTVRTPSGTYKTVEVQTGTVSSVSTSAITVKSTDGYVQTYAVTSQTVVDAQRDGISSIAKGDQVSVEATTVSGKETATSVFDTTKIGSSRAGFGFGGPPGGPGKPWMPNPGQANFGGPVS